jgi:RNA polymerase sigma-B factor
MHGSRLSSHDVAPFDDLDVAAEAYARQWDEAGAEYRGRLRADLIAGCVPFADRMARRYRGHVEPLDDLEQVARLALIKAVDRYNPNRGSFTAFAIITISGELKRHFRDRTWCVHVTRRLQNLVLEVGQATVELTAVLARAPTAAELAQYLDLDPEEIRRAQECAAVHFPVSLNTPIDDGGGELGDLLGDRDESVETVPDKVTVAELIRVLPARVQQVIALRFGSDLSQAQIATEVGFSQMHVSRLLRQAMTWLRAALLSDVAPPWPGAEDCRVNNLRVRTGQGETAVRVTVQGEVDRDTAERLRLHLHSAIAKAAPGPVIIDLAGMPLIDAAGVAVLHDAYVTAALAGVTVALTGVRPHVAAVLATLRPADLLRQES